MKISNDWPSPPPIILPPPREPSQGRPIALAARFDQRGLVLLQAFVFLAIRTHDETAGTSNFSAVRLSRGAAFSGLEGIRSQTSG